MKKVISKLGLILSLGGIVIGFSGCNPNNPQPNNPSTGTPLQWTATIEGQTYSWQGSYPTTVADGSATATGEGVQSPFSIMCVRNSPQFSMAIGLPNYGTGSFTLNQSTYPSNIFLSIIKDGQISYSNAYVTCSCDIKYFISKRTTSVITNMKCTAISGSYTNFPCVYSWVVNGIRTSCAI